MSAEAAYRELLTRYRERALLESCAAALAWDEETYLPDGGVELRAEQQALLARLEHERACDPTQADLLAEAERRVPAPGSVEAVNLAELRREHDEAIRVPVSLMAEIARTTSRAQATWEAARDGAPGAEAAHRKVLARVVELTQAWADCLRGDGSRYDACLDEWEPGLTEREVERVFAALEPPLVALLDRIVDAAGPGEPALLRRPVAVACQRQLAHQVVDWFGFDRERGRLDEAAHPSTMRLGPGDVRLTTRFLPERPFAGLFSTLHELGHGLYDQHLPTEHYGTPVGEPRSLALHESQSRLVENLIGRSRGFWRFAWPRMQPMLAPAFDDVDLDAVYRAINHVGRTLNRVEADEVSYDLHVAIRVRLERALIAGELRVDELPGAWDEAYAAVLARPPDPIAGYLQDGHWAAGMFGYFPTYTLGNLISAQLFAVATGGREDLDDRLAAGEVGVVLDWMLEHVHRHGGLLRCDEVMAGVGVQIGVDAQLARLRDKYATLHRL